jgi:hypothetical protein
VALTQEWHTTNRKEVRLSLEASLVPRRTLIRRSTSSITACAMLFLSSLAHAQTADHCADAATDQAKKLLEFHFGSDSRIEIDKNVKEMTPIRNPANEKQSFDVLEVWGYIYKGQYRMRFIYARIPGQCVLMGQEILEYASL